MSIDDAQVSLPEVLLFLHESAQSLDTLQVAARKQEE